MTPSDESQLMEAVEKMAKHDVILVKTISMLKAHQEENTETMLKIAKTMSIVAERVKRLEKQFTELDNASSGCLINDLDKRMKRIEKRISKNN